MYSRIFQVSEKPIKKGDYISESRYYDGFVGGIADYVAEIKDRDSEIRWLSDFLGKVAEFEGDSFTVVNKEAYFAEKYDSFKGRLEDLSKITIEEFMGNGSESHRLYHLMYLLNEEYSDKYGFYMDDNGEYGGNETLDDFMRHAVNGQTFYIGNIFEYHY